MGGRLGLGLNHRGVAGSREGAEGREGEEARIVEQFVSNDRWIRASVSPPPPLKGGYSVLAACVSHRRCDISRIRGIYNGGWSDDHSYGGATTAVNAVFLAQA